MSVLQAKAALAREERDRTADVLRRLLKKRREAEQRERGAAEEIKELISEIQRCDREAEVALAAWRRAEDALEDEL